MGGRTASTSAGQRDSPASKHSRSNKRPLGSKRGVCCWQLAAGELTFQVHACAAHSSSKPPRTSGRWAASMRACGCPPTMHWWPGCGRQVGGAHCSLHPPLPPPPPHTLSVHGLRPPISSDTSPKKFSCSPTRLTLTKQRCSTFASAARALPTPRPAACRCSAACAAGRAQNSLSTLPWTCARAQTCQQTCWATGPGGSPLWAVMPAPRAWASWRCWSGAPSTGVRSAEHARDCSIAGTACWARVSAHRHGPQRPGRRAGEAGAGAEGEETTAAPTACGAGTAPRHCRHGTHSTRHLWAAPSDKTADGTS